MPQPAPFFTENTSHHRALSLSLSLSRALSPPFPTLALPLPLPLPLPYKKMSGTAGGNASKQKVESSKPSDTPSFKRKRGVFQKDLQHMMYGYGDDPNPLPETVALVEDIVVEYVTDLVHKAQDVASKRGKLLTEDFLFLIRKDLPKLNRCTELLAMNEELKQARKAFEVDEEKLATVD